MSFDILGALRRAITFPAAHNSLTDVLGADAAKVVAGLAHDVVATAAGNALGSIALAGIRGAAVIQEHVAAEVTKALKNASPALATSINASIATAIGNAETIAIGQIPGLVENITKAVGGVLKVSQ